MSKPPPPPTPLPDVKGWSSEAEEAESKVQLGQEQDAPQCEARLQRNEDFSV